jgi:hypothetical protein
VAYIFKKKASKFSATSSHKLIVDSAVKAAEPHYPLKRTL